ncbi:putative outer membrane starch-binding protein [Mucilaginibacter yixingensis]|uniref:Putative outer membrane starch-binding protein n=1 Tax=Mucilaginibacter yixingensis TaxID=1295612 RepID=A0A2T5J921_9SPHI|nr:RagB/SusD family nutrient uptake outer membrane protein [Mucilaginibacter yixingensis]PTQ96565.1 putative outer membrane starch-binding protein [Mucilaginibacter yixingensis]
MNIRSKYCLLAAVACLSVITSCKKFLDFQSPSALNIDQTFATTDNTNNEIISIYNKAAGRSAFGSNLAYVLPAGADDFSAQGAASFDPTQNYAISNYGENSNTGSLFDTFNQLYAGIERANIACKYIPLSPAYTGTSASDKLIMQRYYGEALALRALFYYELIINWGDVPATWTPSADAPTQFIKNTDRDSTYDKILDDLKLASTYVGWRTDLPDYGSFRLTKAAIKALRARIALARGGYSLRTQTHTMERRNDYQKYYQIAFDECNDIIQSGQHQLNPVYENIFKTLHSPTRYDDAHELIFEIAMWGGMNDSDLARSYGTGFNNSPTWGKAGGGPNGVPTYFYEFQNGTDARRDVTLSTYLVGDKEAKSVNGLTGLQCGKFRKSWTSFTSASTLLTFGVNWPVVRYADVLLMYAEAANELQTNGVITPLQALQLVQKRAYGTNPIPVTPTDKTGFFNAIARERLLEFGGEGLRKYDLIRWNLLAAKINEVKAKLPFLTAGASTVNNPYNYVPDYVYFLPTTFGNKECSTEESTINLYGGNNNVAYYTANTAVPSGYTRSYWRAQLGIWSGGVLTKSEFITDPNRGFICKFQENKSELLPYPQKVMIENRGAIIQNYGYTQ